MNVIWKAPLFVGGLRANEQKLTVNLPVFSRILHVGRQHGSHYVWFMCDPANRDKKQPVDIYVIVTGEEFETLSIGDHIGTLISENESMVFHFFKERHSA